MPVPRLAFALALLCGLSGATAQDPAPSPPPDAVPGLTEAVERGRRLADSACASCHAPGPAGASPMAEAPPFREIGRRYPLDQLESAFAEGLVTSHPAMPALNFRASEIDDLIAWFESLQAEPQP